MSSETAAAKQKASAPHAVHADPEHVGSAVESAAAPKVKRLGGGSLPPNLNARNMLALQQAVGNQAVQRMVTRTAPVVQRAADSAAPVVQRDAMQEKLQKRREIIDAAAREEAPGLSKTYFNSTRASVAEHVNTVLTGDAALSAAKTKATQVIGAAMNEQGRGQGQKLADAKRYVDELTEAAMPQIKESLKSEAQQLVEGHFAPSQLQDEYQRIVLSSYASIQPDLDRWERTQKGHGEDAAKAKLKERQASVIQTTKTATGPAFRQRLLSSERFLGSIASVTGAKGKAEVEKRVNQDDKLGRLVGNDVDVLYQGIETRLTDVGLHKLGIGRGFFESTSDELKKLHGEMKQQAMIDLQARLDQELSTSSTIDVLAKELADAKGYSKDAQKAATQGLDAAVEAVLRTQATQIARQFLPPSAKDDILSAAKTRGYSVSRTLKNDSPSEWAKAAKAAKEGATLKASEIFTELAPGVEDEARKIAKGRSKLDASFEGKQDQKDSYKRKKDDLKAAAKVEPKVIKDVIEANGFDSALTKMAPLVDSAVPNPGESASLEIEVKIPVFSVGLGEAYVLFAFAGEVKRDNEDGDKQLTVSSSITFGAGYTAFGFDANFRMGLFLEAAGKDSQAALNLMSYGLYRQMQNVSEKASAYLWGGAGKALDGKEKDPQADRKGYTDADRAELWAAKIEKQVMDENAYVDVGLLAKLSAEVKAGVLEADASASYKGMRRYTKATIQGLIERANQKAVAAGGNALKAKFGEQITAADLTRPDDAKKLLEERRRILQEGAVRRKIEVAGKAKAKWFGGQSLEFGLEASFTRQNNHWAEVEIVASGSLPFAFGGDASELTQWAARVGPAIGATITNLVGTAKARAEAEESGTQSGGKENANEKSRHGGNVADTAMQGALMAKGGSDDLGASFVNLMREKPEVNDTAKDIAMNKLGKASLTEEPEKPGAPEEEGTNSSQSALKVKLTFGVGWEENADLTATMQTPKLSIEVQQVKAQELKVPGGYLKVKSEKAKRLAKLQVGGGKGFRYEALGMGNYGTKQP